MVKKVLAKTYIYLVLLLMYVPILIVIAYSFTTTSQIGQWNGIFTMKLYAYLFKNNDIMVALGNTFILAVISAAVSTLLGTIVPIVTYYANKKSRAVIENINQIPVVNAE